MSHEIQNSALLSTYPNILLTLKDTPFYDATGSVSVGSDDLECHGMVDEKFQLYHDLELQPMKNESAKSAIKVYGEEIETHGSTTIMPEFISSQEEKKSHALYPNGQPIAVSTKLSRENISQEDCTLYSSSTKIARQRDEGGVDESNSINPLPETSFTKLPGFIEMTPFADEDDQQKGSGSNPDRISSFSTESSTRNEIKKKPQAFSVVPHVARDTRHILKEKQSLYECHVFSPICVKERERTYLEAKRRTQAQRDQILRRDGSLEITDALSPSPNLVRTKGISTVSKVVENTSHPKKRTETASSKNYFLHNFLNNFQSLSENSDKPNSEQEHEKSRSNEKQGPDNYIVPREIFPPPISLENSRLDSSEYKANLHNATPYDVLNKAKTNATSLPRQHFDNQLDVFSTLQSLRANFSKDSK